jgi:hypothetical protein
MGKLKLNALRFACILFFGGLMLTSNAQGVLVRQANVIVNANCHGYLEYLPPGYNASSAQGYPLLLFFNGHGTQGDGSFVDLGKFFTGGGTPPEQCDLGWWVPSYTVGGQTFSFIIITPQFLRSFCCEAMPNAGEVDGIINYMIQHYNVDESRIYMTGVSSGAFVPFEYVATGGQFANRIAAIAPFATTSWVSQNKADTVAKYDVPVWAFHNQLDINVFAVNTINWVNGINNPTAPVAPPVPVAKMTIFAGVTSHVCWWDPYLRNYTENGLNLYEWMLQYNRPVVNNAPLPVNFSNLNAKCFNGEVQLTWQTASEKNTSGFAIEKSGDGRNWKTIATVKAAGQSSTEQTYSYTDKNSEGNLYRIVANDIDGKKTYSSVVKGSCADAGSFSIYPSPVIDEATLQLNLSSKAKVSFRMIDNNGRVVLQQQKLIPAGTNQFSINLRELPAGVYTINASWENQSRNSRFVKQ